MSASTPGKRPGADSPGEARPAPRKHRRTGNPNGGKRPGAGRPKGSKNTLPLGSVAAVKALRLRVPKDAPEEHAALADEALGTVVDVMRGRGGRGALFRLMAAKEVRLEICGPMPKQIQVGGLGGGPVTVRVDRDE